jgi:hypothetical protein
MTNTIVWFGNLTKQTLPEGVKIKIANTIVTGTKEGNRVSNTETTKRYI